MRISRVALAALAAALAGAASAANNTPAETVLSVDASAPGAAPTTGYLRTGSTGSPSGHTLEVNSRYLVRDGRPWLPVMGEFHYTRVPASDWDRELAKAKAAGLDIVSTYVIWQHHEEREGQFDWSGDRDLRRFVELCDRQGLKVVLRLGPWVHAEVRFGGLPDWVVRAMPTRSDDPAYLKYAGRFFEQIGAQVRGLLWKDGGPVIGVQLENEYSRAGPNEGRAHIANLKALAVKAGLDVPLYTVTAWDNAIYPAREVAPMFGSYPDAPWATSALKLPPNEAYAFRFQSRVTGDVTPPALAATAAGDADSDAPQTPFLSAEYAGGLPAMYRRRTVLTPDDVASMLTVQIGSGVNLYGYYMFHGGTNPPGEPTREENTGIGGYNDLLLVNYDFQAPLGAYGQQHAVLSKLRPMHSFLRAFGEDLAPMIVRKPERTPTGLDDLSTPRFAVRSLEDSGFLFVSNHVRLYPMADQGPLRFSVKLPHETIELPRTAIRIPTDSYFVWPLNMNLDGVRLAYATVQPITRVESESGPTYVFRAVDGIPVELAFDAATLTNLTSRSGRVDRNGGHNRFVVSGIQPGTGEGLAVKARNGTNVRILVLSEKQAERLWVVNLAGRERLLLTEHQVFMDGEALELRSKGNPQFSIALFPALVHAPHGSIPLHAGGRDGVFQVFSARAPAQTIPVEASMLREPQKVPPVVIGGPARAAVQPAPEVFGKSGAWVLTVSAEALPAVQEAYLQIDYEGDVARLFSGTTLLDDDYYNGLTWEVGLKRFSQHLREPLTLTILPLRSDAPIYIEEPYRPKIAPDAQIARLTGARVIPEYGVRIQ